MSAGVVWCRWCRWRRLVSFGVSAISIGRLPSGWYVRLSQTVSVICDGGECFVVRHCLSLFVIVVIVVIVCHCLSFACHADLPGYTAYLASS